MIRTAILKNTLRTLTAALTFLGAASLYAQAPSSDTSRIQIGLLARVDRDSVVLRWAPSTPIGWSIGIDNGYIVERARVDAEGSIDPEGFKLLTPVPLKVWTREQFKARLDKSDRYTAVAAQLLYGKTPVSNPADGELGAIRDAASLLQNRYGFALFSADVDPKAAEALGLRFVDRGVTNDQRYIYRVYLASVHPEYSVDTAYKFVQVSEFQRLPGPVTLNADEQDGKIMLVWDRSALGFSGFYIERSNDGGKSYTRLNSTPLVKIGGDGMVHYTDTAVANTLRYHYRVQGVTPFGELSDFAEVVAAGRDLTPPSAPGLNNPQQIGSHSVRVSWDMKDAPSDLAGFIVTRGDSADAEGEVLVAQKLSPSTREFIDTAATLAKPYYTVIAVDTAGNTSRSFAGYIALSDTTPPSVPTGLTGSIDSNGVVHLRWNLGDEPNLMGYRVLWANASDHKFAQATNRPLVDTVFTDSVELNTLTEYIYYQVVAESDRYVRSAPTAILALRRPDIVPPVSSVFNDVKVNDSSVALSWARSSSRDLAGQKLYRRQQGESEWKEVASLDRVAEGYLDREVKQKTIYEYQLVALDSAGLRSEPSVPVQGRPYDDGVRSGVGMLKATYDPARRTVVIGWDYANPPSEGFRYMLYRAKEGYSLRQYRAVDSKQSSFEDTGITGNARYTYAVRVITDDGGESPISAQATIEIKE